MIDNSSKFVMPQTPPSQNLQPAAAVESAPQIQHRPPMQPMPAAPVQQYGYMLPTEFVKLPSAGKFYREGSALHNKEGLEITYMTTKQEDILSNPSFMTKGTTLGKLIESILVDKTIRVDELLLGDRNAILIAARASGYGPAYGISAACQRCFKTQEVIIDLAKIQAKEGDYAGVETTERGTFIVELPKSEAFVELKILTINDETKLAQLFVKKMEHDLPPEPVFEKHRATIVSVNGNQDFGIVADFIAKMPISDSRYLQKRYNDLVPDMNFVYSFECESCDHQSEGGIPVDTTFFWPND